MKKVDPASFGQALQVLTLISHKDPSGTALTNLLRSGVISDFLEADPDRFDRTKLRASIGLDGVQKTITINSAYRSWAQRVKDCDFAEVSDWVTEANFPIDHNRFRTPDKEYDVRVFYPKPSDDMNGNDVRTRMHHQGGYTPANFLELIAYAGGEHKLHQLREPILAIGQCSLGSSQSPIFPVISRGGRGRLLTAMSLNYLSDRYVQFGYLGIRK